MDLGVDPGSGNFALVLTVDASNWGACSEYSANNVSFAVILTVHEKHQFWLTSSH